MLDFCARPRLLLLGALVTAAALPPSAVAAGTTASAVKNNGHHHHNDRHDRHDRHDGDAAAPADQPRAAWTGGAPNPSVLEQLRATCYASPQAAQTCRLFFSQELAGAQISPPPAAGEGSSPAPVASERTAKNEAKNNNNINNKDLSLESKKRRRGARSFGCQAVHDLFYLD